MACVRLLLSQGVALDVEDYDGYTPFHLATQKGFQVPAPLRHHSETWHQSLTCLVTLKGFHMAYLKGFQALSMATLKHFRHSRTLPRGHSQHGHSSTWSLSNASKLRATLRV